MSQLVDKGNFTYRNTMHLKMSDFFSFPPQLSWRIGLCAPEMFYEPGKTCYPSANPSNEYPLDIPGMSKIENKLTHQADIHRISSNG